MCCFSRPVKLVAKTKIFARAEDDGRQALAYAMDVELAEELAMVLPLPVPPRAAEDAVRFVALDGYETFFADLERAFPEQAFAAQAKGGLLSRGGPMPVPKLVVHDVGSFEASFVPTRADFARLDERFQLPSDVWDHLPAYADWGFAVFRLKPMKGWFGGSRRQTIHPMAFTFPRRDEKAIFFPTVHVHDGHVEKTAHFDHQLYVQGTPVLDALLGWTESTSRLGTKVDVERAKGLVDGARSGMTHMLFGTMNNTDTWLREPAGVTLDDLRGSGESWRYAVKAAYAFFETDHLEERHRAWGKTAKTNLPALCRALREGLPALLDANRDAWKLGPLHAALAPHWMNGPHLWKGSTWMDQDGPGKPGGPGRVKLTAFTDRVEPQEIELGFTELPDDERLGAIVARVRQLLDAI